MAEEIKQVAGEGQTGEGQAGAGDSTAALEAITKQLNELSEQNKGLQEVLSKTKMELFNPKVIEMLEKLESGEGKKVVKSPIDDYSEEELAALPEKKRLGMIVTQTAEAVKKAMEAEYGKNMKSLAESVEYLQAKLELQVTEAKYEDFHEYKEAMGKLLKQHPNANYEQLYKLAKADVLVTKSEQEKEKEASRHSEKPGRASSRSMTAKNDLSPTDAAEAAWQELVGGKESL